MLEWRAGEDRQSDLSCKERQINLISISALENSHYQPTGV